METDDVGRSGVAELAVVVRAGDCARGDGHTRHRRALSMSLVVFTNRCDVEHTVGLESHERGEDQVRDTPAAHTVAGGEHKVGQRLPASAANSFSVWCAEPGGERHPDTVLAQAANRFGRACDRGGFAFVDERSYARSNAALACCASSSLPIARGTR